MTRRGGTTVLVGIAGGGTFTLPTMRMCMEDRTLKGSYYGSARVLRDFPRFIELIESGRVDVGGMVTKHFALDEVNRGDRRDAQRRGRAGSAGRRVSGTWDQAGMYLPPSITSTWPVTNRASSDAK